MTDHSQIWLQPWCAECKASGEDRTWCSDDVYDPCDCGEEPVRYVKANRANAESERIRQALRNIATDNVPRDENCAHGRQGWQECAACIRDYARAELGKEEQAGGR